MKITRSIIRKIILREVRNASEDPSRLQGLVNKLSGMSVKGMLDSIGEEEIVDYVEAISSDEATLRDIWSSLDDNQKQNLVDFLGQARGSIQASLYEKIKDTLSKIDPKIRLS